MRYVILDKGLGLSQVETECRRYGGKSIKVMSICRQVFVELDEAGLAHLKTIPGLSVKNVERVKHTEYGVLPYPSSEAELKPTYSASQASIFPGFNQLRDMFTPPLTGEKCTIAILDTGIRKTHQGLVGKIIHEANFSDSPSCDDVFDHGTGVAYMAGGGMYGVGQESGLAPSSYLMNIKVLNDEGEGTDETIVAGIEECYRLERKADEEGLVVTDPMDINIVNMSFGKPDTGDPDDPIRAALHMGIEQKICKFLPIVAAGNGGPDAGSILCPGCDPNVITLGATLFPTNIIWEESSRGPTKEGLIKPDVAGPAVGIVTASARGDNIYRTASGTSFAAPGGSGAFSLMWELLRRRYGEAFLDQWVMDPEYLQQLILPMVSQLEGIPLGKNNDYGWGTWNPLKMIQEAAASAILEPVMAFLPVVVMVGMMKMMTNVTRKM